MVSIDAKACDESLKHWEQVGKRICQRDIVFAKIGCIRIVKLAGPRFLDGSQDFMRIGFKQSGIWSVAAAVMLFTACSGGGTDQTVAALQQQEIERLRQENQELDKLRAENQEVQRLRRENQELPKLRSQYQELLQLRKENEQLRNQLARAQQRLNPAR